MGQLAGAKKPLLQRYSDIQSCFEVVKVNVDALAERGNFTFQFLKTRMGKNLGNTLNAAIQAKLMYWRKTTKSVQCQLIKVFYVLWVSLKVIEYLSMRWYPSG